MNCPTHNIPLTAEESKVGTLYVCPVCDYCTTERQMMRLNSEEPVEKAPAVKARHSGVLERARFVKEADLVDAIYKDLRADGYIVLRVGQYRAKGSGTDIGTPDLFISHPRTGNRHWALEAKLPGEKPSAEQQALIDAGVSCIVQSVEEARAVVERERGNEAR